MSSSRGTENHDAAFRAFGSVDPAYADGHKRLISALGLAVEDAGLLGDDWVLHVDAAMLAKCRELVASGPPPHVLTVLVLALQGSYHLKGVHELLVEVTAATVAAWREGHTKRDMQDLFRHLGLAFRYGVKANDLDFVFVLCAEPSFVVEGDPEDLRRYWFASLAKIRDPRVGEFCRSIVRNDIGRWSDTRILDAVYILGKTWEEPDADLCQLVAEQCPDSEIRREARRIIKRHGQVD